MSSTPHTLINEKELYAALREGDVPKLSAMLSDCPAKTASALMGRLHREHRALLYRTLPKDTAVETFDDLDATLKADLLGGLLAPEVTAVFEEMDPDDRAELLDELPASVATRLLAGLSEDERELTGIVPVSYTHLTLPTTR